MQDIDFSDSRFDGVTVAADWIRDLESSDSRLHKEAVVEKALMAANLGSAGAQCFLFNCFQAYNPFYVFGVRQVPETVGLVNRPNPWTEFWALLENLRTRGVTGHRARDRIQAVAEQFDSDEWNGLARRVLIKDLRCGISEKTLNKVLKNTLWAIPVFSCQLAQDSTDQPRKLKGIKRLEVKLDGVRVLAVVAGDTVNLYSRNGKSFDNFPQIAEAIAEHRQVFQHGSGMGGRFVLDGEIVGESFQKLMKQAHRKSDAQTDGMTYHVFDIIPLADFERGYWNAPQHKRIDLLDRARETLPADAAVQAMPGMLVDLDTAEGHDVMRRFAEASVEQGYEGIMIKSQDAPYECKRSSFWMKWKPVIEVSLEIIDVEQGTGRNAGRMGALVCSGHDDGRDIRVNVGSGFSDELRDQLWIDHTSGNSVVGSIVEVQADAVTQNQDGTYSLRFPRFKSFRGFEPGEKL
jgi:DNA ligase-1